MRYQVMTHEMGRPIEQIGEAELADPVGATAAGTFFPGPGYARVRHIFLLRTQGLRDAYRDGRDLLGLKLYRDGIGTTSERVDIEDPDRIEVVFTPAEIVEGEAVGNWEELSYAMAMWKCPTCGGPTQKGQPVFALPGSRYAAKAWKPCPVCKKAYVVLFPAKPGWKAR